MIRNKKEFTSGLVLLVLFFVVLAIMFMPIFNGHNAMAYLDSLYNSISKGSAYYVTELRAGLDEGEDSSVALSITYGTGIEAQQASLMLREAGVEVSVQDKTLDVQGSLRAILSASLADADSMYSNNGQALEDRYGLEARRSLFNWWTTLRLMEKELMDQGEFTSAKTTSDIMMKAVETSYNYFGIEPMKVSDNLWLVLFSLLFYVGYTLWYGFAILFLFEGWGLRLSH